MWQFQMEHEHHLVIQFVIEHEHQLSQDAKIDRNEERNHRDHSKIILNEFSCDIILPGDQLEGQYLQRHQVIEIVTNRKADFAHESPQEISPKKISKWSSSITSGYKLFNIPI